MSVYSTKELHNCKVESEAAGINNGSSFKKKKKEIFLENIAFTKGTIVYIILQMHLKI